MSLSPEAQGGNLRFSPAFSSENNTAIKKALHPGSICTKTLIFNAQNKYLTKNAETSKK
jgi:hypothetical protein